jgi:hypothetical protein
LLTAAVWILTLAVAAGTALALWHLRATGAGSRPPAAAGIAHGVIGAAGLAVLLLVLRGPPRGVAAGVGSFGSTAAVLFGAALLAGLIVLWRRRTGPAVTMAIHSGLAVTGYVLLLAWNGLG